MELEVGDVLENWEILSLLGEGGMGAVYRARNTVLDDVFVALKVTHPRNYEHARERFGREVKSLLRLNHPAVVRVQGFGEDRERGLLWFAMDLVEGYPLDRWIDEGVAFPIDHSLRMFGLLAGGLAHAHERGVAHRDLKPANIIVRADGSPVMVDFGISVTEGETRLTRTGAIIGTPQYLPPEALDGRLDDPMLGDLYALGQMMVETLTGGSAFPTDPKLTSTQNALKIMHQKVQKVNLDPGEGFPESLRALCCQITHEDPKQRMASAVLFGEALYAVHEELDPTDRASTPIAARASMSGSSALPTVPFVGTESGGEASSSPSGVRSATTTSSGSRRRGLIFGAGALVVMLVALGGIAALGAVAGVGWWWYASSDGARAPVASSGGAGGQGDRAADRTSTMQVDDERPGVEGSRDDDTGGGSSPSSNGAAVGLSSTAGVADNSSPSPRGAVAEGEPGPPASEEPQDGAIDEPPDTADLDTGDLPVDPSIDDASPTDEPALAIAQGASSTEDEPEEPTTPVKPEPAASGPAPFRPDWSQLAGIKKGMGDSDLRRLFGPGGTGSSAHCRGGESAQAYLDGGVVICSGMFGGARRAVIMLPARKALVSRGVDPKVVLLGMGQDEVERVIGAPQARPNPARFTYNYQTVILEFSRDGLSTIVAEL